jgi:hypothetical protein
VANWREDRSRPSVEDRWQRSRDLVNSGVRRTKAQALGVPSHERRSGERIGTVHLKRMRGRDQGDLTNLGVHRVKVQVLGVASREGARSERRIAVGSGPQGTVGSARGIVCRRLARKSSRVWPRGSRDREKRYPDSWRQCGP